VKNLIVIAVLLVGLLAWAQDKPAVPELTKSETLHLTVLLKNVQLADKDVQLARMQFLNLTQIQAAQQRIFNLAIQVARDEHNLPVGEFLFDAATLKFVPVPKEKKKE
jgi:hypothetical protein